MKISVKIFLAFSLILLLFSITTFVNNQQSKEVSENNKWLTRSQNIIRLSGRYQRNIIDIEGDFRGFLLTNDFFYLKSYDSLNIENSLLFSDLKRLATNSYQSKRIDSISALHYKWKVEIANPLIQNQAKTVANISVQLKAFYKNDREQVIRRTIIDLFKEFNNYEYELRDQRKAKLNASVQKTGEISMLLTGASILIGFIVALYVASIISKRIYKMVNLAEEIAKGNFNIFIRDKSKDELSNLSFSLNEMARRLSENFHELEKKNHELNQKNKELDQFAYVISHDLKAPLRGMENVSIWIEEDLGSTLDPKMKEYLGIFKGRIKRMENLIEGILDLSRVGKRKRETEFVDVNFLIKDIIEMQAIDPGFKINIPQTLPAFVTEKLPLQQVFSNLISNSVKYNDKELGEIAITFQELDHYYSFSISDNGPGISEKYHEKIFIVFQTLVERDAFESTGVGLAIVKKILEDKNCVITVNSFVGSGATFTFTWPKEL